MENRFGIKDFFLFGVLAVLLVVIGLAMLQFDRQYQLVTDSRTQLSRLATDVAELKRQVGSRPAGGQGNAEITAALAELKSELSRLKSVGVSPGTASDVPDVTPPAKVVDVSRDPSKPDAFTAIVAAEAQPDFARGDWLLDNFGTKVGKMTPLVSSDIYQTWVESQVCEGLAVRDPDSLEYVPRLATSWVTSPDGLTMTFKLRQGVVFSDGRPLTAEDVLFTFDFIRNPQINAPRARAYLEKLKSVTAPDAQTIVFTFTEVYFQNFETVASTSIFPKHYYSKFTPNQFNESVGLLVGSGPYRLEGAGEWAPGNGVVLVRNERYWGPKPAFNQIRFAEIQDENSENVAIGNQELDNAAVTPDQYKNLTTSPKINAIANNYAYNTPYGGYTYIAWNQVKRVNGQDTPTRFADKRVRQAMTMLIDRERLAKEIYQGYATVASGPFAPTGPQSDPGVKPLPYDVDRAVELLKQAGYEDRNGDGVIEDAKGEPFEFAFDYPGGNLLVEKIVLFFSDSFKIGGIVMKANKLDWPVLVDKLNKSDFQAVTLGWSGSPESDAYQVFHSSQIADQGDNRTSYRNAEIDQAIDDARKTLDKNARMELWHKVHRILAEDQPYTFLLNRQTLRLVNKRVHNIDKSNIGLNFEYLNGGLMPWYVPKGEQKYTN